MNFSNSYNNIRHHLSSSSKAHKKRLSQEQLQLLESNFDPTKKLEPERKFWLARELGIPPRQIAIWYQNKRARWKNQSLELDYSSLQVKLESALADNRELQKEIDHLHRELKRAQAMVFSFSPAQTQVCPPVSSLSNCGEEGGGSSSMNDDVGCSDGNNWTTIIGNHNQELAGLQYEEMYAACFMMGGPKGTASAGPMPNNVLNNERDFWL